MRYEKYASLLKLAGKRGKAPSLGNTKWSGTEKNRMERNVCVACGTEGSGRTSYLCPRCESEQSPVEIRAEIDLARSQLLKYSK
jgi:hypothetical protein